MYQRDFAESPEALAALANHIPSTSPDLLCPFKSAIHPAASQIQASTMAWAQRYGLVQSERSQRRFVRLQYGILMARAYPHASTDALSLIADWNTWLFHLDDQCDEQGLGREAEGLVRLHTQLLAILRGAAPLAHDGQLEALYDIISRMRACRDDQWMERFITRVDEYFQANVWEAQNRAQRLVPSEADYHRMRPFTGAVFCYITLIELANTIFLTPEMVASPAVQRLASMTNNVICWSNDIISLQKELMGGDWHNLVYIVYRQRGLTIEQAITEVVQLHDNEVRAFQHLSQKTIDVDGTSSLAEYIGGMQYWMRANLDWSAATTRYRPAREWAA